jgi:hypothetical protein
MKHLTFFALTALIALSSSCTLKEVIGPDGDIKITNVSGSASGSTGGGNNTGGNGSTTGTSNSDSYQPVTKGSTWNYVVSQYGLSLNFVYAMTGNTTVQNGLTLNEFNFTVTTQPTEQGYYIKNDHLYIIRQKHDINFKDVVVNVPYLKDDAAVGDTWKGDNFDPGATDYTGQYTCKMLETNITKTINGKTFSNVFRTHTDLTLTYTGSGTGSNQLIESYDYYIAKGVGIIELDDFENGIIIGTQVIGSYTIK